MIYGEWLKRLVFSQKSRASKTSGNQGIDALVELCCLQSALRHECKRVDKDAGVRTSVCRSRENYRRWGKARFGVCLKLKARRIGYPRTPCSDARSWACLRRQTMERGSDKNTECSTALRRTSGASKKSGSNRPSPPEWHGY